MRDRLSQAAKATFGGDSDKPVCDSESTVSPNPTDVLQILEDIESQFTRLKTVRKEQVDSLRELTERSARLESMKMELVAERDALETKTRDLATEHQRAKVALDDSKRCLEADRRSHERRVEEDKAMLARDRESLHQDRERIRHEQCEKQEDIERIQSELHTRAAQIAEEEEAVRIARVQLENEQESRKRDYDDLLAALLVARQMLENRGHQLRLQTQRIDQDRSTRKRLLGRRRSLECCVRRQRKQITSLEVERDAQRAWIEEAGRRLHSFMNQLKEQGDLVERGNAALLLVDSLECRIEGLESELKDARMNTVDVYEERLQDIERKNQSLQDQLSDKESTCITLENRLAKLPHDVDLIELEDKKRRLAEIACHLHRRRERLRFLRSKRPHRMDAVSEADIHQARSQQLRQSEIIEQRQLELDDVRKMLASSEGKMIRKWAAPKSIVLTCWITTVLAILGTASWFGADRITPALRSTSITLAPRDGQNDMMNQETLDTWQGMHQSQLKSDGFIRDVAQRSAARRLEPWTSFESVKRLIEESIRVDLGIPGQFTLTMASTHPAKAADFMEILGGSMVVDAQRSLASRPGGRVSELHDARMEDGIVRHARTNSIILKDERLVTAGVILAGSIVLVAMILGIIYSRLIRAKRIFDQEHSEEIAAVSIRPI